MRLIFVWFLFIQLGLKTYDPFVNDDIARTNLTITVDRNPNRPFWPAANRNYAIDVNEEEIGILLVKVEASDDDGVSDHCGLSSVQAMKNEKKKKKVL